MVSKMELLNLFVVLDIPVQCDILSEMKTLCYFFLSSLVHFSCM